MNENLNEMFSEFWKKFVRKQKQVNLQSSQQTEPSAVSRPSTRKRTKAPRQLMLPLNRKKKQLNLPLHMPPQPGDFSMDKVYTDIAKAWDRAARMKSKEEKQEKDFKKFQRMLKKKGKTMDDFGLSEFNAMINEIIEEELNEINYTSDSSGKRIIAQGAPGSVIRFVTENPDIIKEMREWIKECQWSDLPDDEAKDELSDEEVLRGIQNGYEGGIRQFIRNSNSKAEVPIGYKESLKENWSGRQFDDEPDGYTNDAQRAFAHSQATTPRKNERKKAEELAKRGKYVILVDYPVYCKSTDACLGGETVIHKVFNKPEEAKKFLDDIYSTNVDRDESYELVSPESIKPKPTAHTTPDDDIPFEEGVDDDIASQRQQHDDYIKKIVAKMVGNGWTEKGATKIAEEMWNDNFTSQRLKVPYYREGVGYVYDKDMKKDPKHIPGKRWTVKYDEKVDEVNEKPDYYKQLQMAQVKAYRQGNAEAVIYYADIMGNPNVASVSFERFKGSHLYDKWKADNADRIVLQQKRFTMPWLQESISKNNLKSMIKELVTELWYGSKNDVEGDEVDDKSLNEILGGYDELIEFVKSLPKEEIEKINALAKEKNLSAYDAVLEYLKSISNVKKGRNSNIQ
jgi:hypothetical protein